MSINFDMFFSLRSLIIKYPLVMQMLFTGVTSVALALMVQIIEGPVSLLINTDPAKPVYNEYSSYLNCIWNIFVVITTGKLISVKPNSGLR